MARKFNKLMLTVPSKASSVWYSPSTRRCSWNISSLQYQPSLIFSIAIYNSANLLPCKLSPLLSYVGLVPVHRVQNAPNKQLYHHFLGHNLVFGANLSPIKQPDQLQCPRIDYIWSRYSSFHYFQWSLCVVRHFNYELRTAFCTASSKTPIFEASSVE